MPLGIEEVLAPALRDRRSRFVFPSEICAEAWLAASLEMGVHAIESDRFLGWDRLKERAAFVDGRPAADDFLRRIFAADLLAQNARAPFLTSVVSPDYVEQWQPFSSFVASRLPSLGRLPTALASVVPSRRSRIGDSAAADWLAIRERYSAFLRGIGRFEPSYEPRCLRALDGTTTIFFPELIEDFAEYRDALEVGPFLKLVSLPNKSLATRLTRPETALSELRLALSEIGDLLDSGFQSEDIAITVPGLDRYRPYLEREASLLSIPLAIRSGTNLASTPGGRLFAAMRDAFSSGFAFDALRDLLLSPAWPWKEPDRLRAIMAEGQRLHAVASWKEDGKKADAWERSLNGGLLSVYRRLKGRISAIVTAPDFEAMLKAYNAFKTDFLSKEKSDWDEIADLTLARCVVELQGLARAQAEAGLSAPGAFGLFMRGLESKPYVSARAGGAGIPVYEWRVAAGIRPKRHFILHASQDALALPSRGFDYLGEAWREVLDSGDDAAPAFIAAYALSGDVVSFSCPESGFGGEEAAHGALAAFSGDESAASEAASDRSYSAEAAWLSGRGPRPERLHRVQALGLAAAAAAPAFSPDDGASLDPATAALAAARLSHRGGPGSPPGMDATSIDAYMACPYAYLYLKLLNAGPQPSGVSFIDALFIGDVYHEALSLLFAGIKETDGAYKPHKAEEYRALVGPTLGQAFAKLAAKRGPFVGIVLETYRDKLAGNLENLIGLEARRFPGFEIGPLEQDFELEYPDIAGGIVLRGRIDRISRSEKGLVIVDYKKGGLPAKSQVAPDEAGWISAAQIPCYLRLVGSQDGTPEIDSAWYISIEGDAKRAPGAAACAFGDGDGDEAAYVPRSALEPLLQAFDRALRGTVEGILAGAFPLAPKESQKTVCANCRARGICRERYALRFGSPFARKVPAAGESG